MITLQCILKMLCVLLYFFPKASLKAWVVHIYIAADCEWNNTASILEMMEHPVSHVYVDNTATQTLDAGRSFYHMCEARRRLLWRYGKNGSECSTRAFVTGPLMKDPEG